MPWVIIAVLVLLVLSKSGRSSAEQDPGPQWHQMPPSDWSVGAHYYGPPPAQPPKAFTPPPADFSGPLARVGAVGAHCAGLNVIDCARATGNLLASGGTGYIVPVPTEHQAPGYNPNVGTCAGGAATAACHEAACQEMGPDWHYDGSRRCVQTHAPAWVGGLGAAVGAAEASQNPDLVELHANIGPGHF